MVATTLEENALSRALDPREIDESTAVDPVLNPGDISIHNPNLMHGSNANTSDMWRRGLTIRYIPTSTPVTDPIHPRPYRLQGKDRERANMYAPRPV